MHTQHIWPDLSSHGAKVFAASFNDLTDEGLILVQFERGVKYDTFIKLKKEGFIRVGDNFFYPHKSISKAKLEKVFGAVHTEEVSTSETHIRISTELPEAIKSVFNVQEDVPDDGFDYVNSFQVRYQSLSNSGDPISVVPASIAFQTQTALKTLEEKHGAIDDFVNGKLQYESHDELFECFSPEQIDALALSIDSADNETGTICADATGLGKGRVGAGLLRWAVMAGRKFVFITEKDNLFTDFIRDVMDIKSLDLVGMPFIMNSGCKIIDQRDGSVMARSLPPAQNKRIIASKTLPEGVNWVATTYSQFNRKGSPKIDFLAEVAKGQHIHTDESHNATGETSNVGQALDQMNGIAASFSSSSATFAKRATGLRFYRRLMPASIQRMDDFTTVLQKGGIPILEALTKALSETGRLIRREHDNSDMFIPVVIDEERKEWHQRLEDLKAPILQRASLLASDIEKKLEEMSADPDAQARKEVFYAVHWASRFSNLDAPFYSSLTIDRTVEKCVEVLKDGGKPVVVILNTMEAVLEELMTDEEGNLQPFLIDEDGNERLPEFKDIISLMIDRSLVARRRVGKADSEPYEIDDPELIRRAEEIKELVKTFPYVPLSAFDEIAQRVEAEGRRLSEAGEIDKPWKMGEISGRKIRVDPVKGVHRVEPNDRNIEIYDFQNGGTDGILLSEAASTGLSLNESPKVKDRRYRAMIEHQTAANPTTRFQFWGRIRRRGGTVAAKFFCMSTALPSQLRVLASRNRHATRLSAVVAGDSESAVFLDVPDVANSLGNKIAKQILEENPMVAKIMQISMKVEEDEDDEGYHFVSKFQNRLSMITNPERDALWHQFFGRYQDALQDMLSKGLHPTKPRELSGKWRRIHSELFNPGNPEDGPVFGAPVYLTTIERDEYVYPISRRELEQLIAQKRLDYESSHAPLYETIKDYLRENQGEFLKAVLPKKFRSIQAAYNSRENNLVKIEGQRIASVQQALKVFRPGNEIKVSNDFGEEVYGIVTSLIPPKDVEDYRKPSAFSLEYVLPGDEVPRRVTLSTLLTDQKYELFADKRSTGEYDPLEKFENLPKGRVQTRRQILDGNDFMAAKMSVEADMGKPTIFTTEGGVRETAVLIPKSKEKMVDLMPVAVYGEDALLDLLEDGINIYTNGSAIAEGMAFRATHSGISIEIPGKKSLGAKFQTPDITEITGDFRGNFKSLKATIPYEDFPKLYATLLGKGESFYVNGAYRKVAIGVQAENHKDREHEQAEMKP